MKDIEIWKDIPGYEGFYQVSNLGRIKSLNYKRQGFEKVLKLYKGGDGFPRVNLWKYGCAEHWLVHRLEAKAFLDDYSDFLEVDHLDSIRDNNNLSNLKMCTRKENNNTEITIKHYSEAKKGKRNPKLSEKIKKNGLRLGEKNPMWGKCHTKEAKKKMSEVKKGKRLTIETKKKLSEAFSDERNPRAKAVICIDNGTVYPTAKQAGEALNVYASSITKVCRMKQKTAGGYRFKYYEPQKTR